MQSEDKATRAVIKRYDRVAAFYDFMEGFMERAGGSKWRQLLWSKVEGRRVLEVGVGTGKNFPYYPPAAEITAVDVSRKMLGRAQVKAEKQGIAVSLQLMDVQDLRFEDNSFDTVVASFVFCSVPDPVRGLKEVQRVCRQGGKAVLLEHMRSSRVLSGRIMDLVNPVVVRMTGENINRRTLDNVGWSGLKVEKVTSLWGDVFRLIEARKG